MPLLQPGDSQGELCSAHFREEGVEVDAFLDLDFLNASGNGMLEVGWELDRHALFDGIDHE